MGGKPSSHKDSDPTVGRKTQEENLVKNPPAGSHDGCTAQNQSGIPVNSATTTTRAKDTTKPSVIPHIASPQTSIQVSWALPANKFPHPRSQVAAGVEVRSKFESPEYNTFVKHFDQMVEGITDPVALSFELYSHKLISQETQSELQDHEMSIPDKNHVLLSTVGQRIILNPAVAFATFLATLESMPFCKDLAANLDETFGFMKSSCASTHEGTANSRMDTVTMQHSMVNPQASPSLVAHQTSKAPQSSMDLTNEQKCVDSNAGMDSTAGFVKSPISAGAHKVTASDMKGLEHSRSIQFIATPKVSPLSVIGLASAPQSNTDSAEEPMYPKSLDHITRMDFTAVILSVGDLSNLTSILRDAAHKWMTIGDQLGFTDGELRSIQSTPVCTTEGNQGCFRELLAQWLKWAPPKHELPTLEKLASAVRETGEERLAYDLPQKFQEKKGVHPASLQRETSQTYETGPIGAYSKHLHSQMKMPCPVSNWSQVSFQQYTYPTQLTPTEYTEIPSPDPWSCAPLDVYAEYLRVFYSQMEMPCAISNWPQVPLQKYINLAVIRTDHLTPAEVSEFSTATIHGCIDDICEKKEPINLSDILKPEGKYQVKRVIIEGVPGIGKSILAWKICRKWGKRKLFQEYYLLVLLKLGDKRIQDAKDVTNLFYHPDPATHCAIVTQIIKSNGLGILFIFEGYDELPESKRESDSVFHRILTGLDLPHAAVIITTRPNAVAEIQSICARKRPRYVEILGFRDREINEYIESSFPNDEKTRDDFQEYLTIYPHIHKLMYVPLNCAVVVELYKNMSSKTSTAQTPKNITHLYTALIIALLQRYLNKHEVYHRQHIILHNFKSLDDKRIKPVHEQFLKMCQLAYTGIAELETELIFHDLSDGLGLMRSVNELYISPTTDQYGPSSSHNFLHLTLQEYLAAFHIAQWNAQDQTAFFKKYINDDKMQTVLAFLSGLTKAGLELWDAVRSFAQHQKMSASCLETTHCIKLPVLRCLFESQSSTACATVLRSTKPIGFRYDGPVVEFDFFVLGYCIANSSCGWDLQIRYPTGTEWVRMLLKGLTCKVDPSSSSRAKGLTGLDISHCKLSDEVLKDLQIIPAFFWQNLTHLIIYNTKLSPNGPDLLGNLLGLLPNLQRFVVWHTRLLHGGAVKVAKHLSRMSNLRDVLIKNACIGLEDFEALNELLVKSESIRMLDLGNNPCSCKVPHSLSPLLDGIAHSKSLVEVALPKSILTSQCVNSLAAKLHADTTLSKLCISSYNVAHHDAIHLTKVLESTAFKHLHSLYMAGCNIRSEGTTSLAKVILAKHCVLEVLDLSENSIGVDGASAIAETMCKGTCLKELYLANNWFGGDGAVRIAKALNENRKSKIEILNLSRNSIAPANVFRRFADSVTKCTRLHNLYLDNCELQTEDAVYLAKLLAKNSTLQILSLSGNPVGEQGAAAFADALRCNKTLLELWLDDKSIGIGGVDTLCNTATNLKVLYLSDACKPEHFSSFSHQQRPCVTFLPQYTEKHLIPPFAPLFNSNRYYFTSDLHNVIRTV